MSEYNRETLSALLDNESDDMEVHRLLKSCDSNPEIKEIWDRYNLVQGLMHDEAVPVSTNLSMNIRKQLVAEPVPVIHRFAWWQQNVIKMAIAASVAVLFTFAIQYNLLERPAPELVTQSPMTNSVLGPAESSRVSENVPIEVDPVAQRLLKEYISRIEINEEEPPHAEHIQDSPLFRLVNELQEREEP